jgi:hypothetical protein
MWGFPEVEFHSYCAENSERTIGSDGKCLITFPYYENEGLSLGMSIPKEDYLIKRKISSKSAR